MFEHLRDSLLRKVFKIISVLNRTKDMYTMSTSIRDGPILTPKLYLVKMFRLWVLFALGIDKLRYPQQRGGIRLVLLELKPSKYLENLPILSGLRSWFVPFWSAAYRSWGNRLFKKKREKMQKGGKLCRDRDCLLSQALTTFWCSLKPSSVSLEHKSWHRYELNKLNKSHKTALVLTLWLSL